MSSSQGGNQKVQQTQEQVDAVVNIMKDNVNKVLDRDAKLNDLEDKSEALHEGAQRFEKSSKALKRKMWYKNLKFQIILGIVVLAVIGIIIWVIVR